MFNGLVIKSEAELLRGDSYTGTAEKLSIPITLACEMCIQTISKTKRAGESLCYLYSSCICCKQK